jgi:hypothetical protein
MKNRYGMDGITFQLNADTSTGHFKITSEYDEDTHSSSSDSSSSYSDLDNFDKKELSKKFFELNS